MSRYLFSELPKTVPCWYCLKDCSLKENFTLMFGKVYECIHHKPLDVYIRCVPAADEEGKWFFNTIRIILKDFRLDYNLYSGKFAQLEKLTKSRSVSGWQSDYWKIIENIPAEFVIDNDIRKIKTYLKYYKVFS